MKSETGDMVLQFLVEQQRMIRDLCCNDLLLIESFLSGQDIRAELGVAAATVRATLYSLDALGDKIHQADAQSRR